MTIKVFVTSKYICIFNQIYVNRSFKTHLGNTVCQGLSETLRGFYVPLIQTFFFFNENRTYQIGFKVDLNPDRITSL